MTERKRVPEQAVNAPVDVSQMNIYQKIMMVSSESGNIEKRLEIATKTDKNGKTLSSYKAASFWDIVDAIKPYLTLYHIAIIPEQDATCGKNVVSDDIVTRSTNYGDREERRVIMWSTLRIVNTDDPHEYILSAGIGEGRDSGDKAYNKASTNSKKNATIDAFNLSIGDDPDKDASLEYYQTSENKQAYKKDQKKDAKADMQISPELVTAINDERRQLESYGTNVRGEAFIEYLKKKTGFETSDPAMHTNESGNELLEFLKKVNKAKKEKVEKQKKKSDGSNKKEMSISHDSNTTVKQQVASDEIVDHNTGEVIDVSDLPF